MHPTQLTEPELAFITDLVTTYRARRFKAIAKSSRKSASSELETLSLNTLVNKLEVLHSQALEASPQTIVNDLPSATATHSDVELPVITPVTESLG